MVISHTIQKIGIATAEMQWNSMGQMLHGWKQSANSENAGESAKSATDFEKEPSGGTSNQVCRGQNREFETGDTPEANRLRYFRRGQSRIVEAERHPGSFHAKACRAGAVMSIAVFRVCSRGTDCNAPARAIKSGIKPLKLPAAAGEPGGYQKLPSCCR
jgi:hypothetical protein